MLKSMNVMTENIAYVLASFSAFDIREVIKEGKSIGIYHVKIKGGHPLNKSLNLFKKAFEGCEVGVVDSTGKLGIDYQIYVIIEDEMIKSCAIGTFKEINNNFC